MTNRDGRYFSNAWGARTSIQEKQDDDEIQVVYHRTNEQNTTSTPKPRIPSLMMSSQIKGEHIKKSGGEESTWRENMASSSFQNKQLSNPNSAQRGQMNLMKQKFYETSRPVSTLISTASKPANRELKDSVDAKSLETNLTFDITQFEMIARQTLDWYGFKDYLCLYTFQTWFLRYVNHIRTFYNRLCNVIDQIERDYRLSSIHIPLQNFQETEQNVQLAKPNFYGDNFLPVIFAKPNSISPDLFGQHSNSDFEQSIKSILKMISSTLQQVLEDPSNGNLSPNQGKSLFPDSKHQSQDRNEESAYKDKWNPINCDMPFAIFVKHVQFRMETSKKSSLPYFDVDIFKLRYVEHMAQVETNNNIFLLSVLTAYGYDICTYPVRVMYLLQRRQNLFRENSKPYHMDYGNNKKAFISIDGNTNAVNKEKGLLPLPLELQKLSTNSVNPQILPIMPLAFCPPSQNQSSGYENLSLSPIKPLMPSFVEPQRDSTKVLRNPIKPIRTDESVAFTPSSGKNSVAYQMPTNTNVTNNMYRNPLLLNLRPNLSGPLINQQRMMNSSFVPPGNVAAPGVLYPSLSQNLPSNQFNPHSNNGTPGFGKELISGRNQIPVPMQNFRAPTPNSRIPGFGNELISGRNQMPGLMQNLTRASTYNTKRTANENTSTVSASSVGKLSFELPFDIWKVVCERSRATAHNYLPIAPLRPLTDEEYKEWYARYLYHVENNYDNFVQGIISGYPVPNYSQEIRNLITHRQLMDEGKCDRVRKIYSDNDVVEQNESNFDEDEEEVQNDAVLYDYGHSSSGVENSTREQDLSYNMYSTNQPNIRSEAQDSYKRRKYY